MNSRVPTSGTRVPAVDCADLSYRLSDAFTVEPIQLSVARGQITAIIGANGAGKTTLLRLICGLLKPTTGTVTIHGEPVIAGRPPDRVSGMIEEPAFFPWMSGENNLKYIAAGRKPWLRRVPEVLETLSLARAAKQPVKSYSQGMRQRLGLARALLGEPRVLLLDEPTNGLDPEGMAIIRDLLATFTENEGAVLVSSHALGEMARIADRLAVMGSGRLLAEGELDAVCHSGESLEDVYFRMGAPIAR